MVKRGALGNDAMGTPNDCAIHEQMKPKEVDTPLTRSEAKARRPRVAQTVSPTVLRPIPWRATVADPTHPTQ